MTKEIREHLEAYNTSKGYGVTDADLMETITEADSIWEGERDEHRWYTLVPTVVYIDGIYLCYDCCDCRDENSDVDDCIGGYKLSDVVEVEPENKTVIVFKKKEK